MANTILGVITGIISIILYVYASFTIRCKGPILSNDYLFACEEERKKLKERSRIEIERDYRVVSVIFGILATVFAFLTVYIFMSWKWCLYVVFVLVIFVLFYAIKQSINTQRKQCPK